MKKIKNSCYFWKKEKLTKICFKLHVANSKKDRLPTFRGNDRLQVAKVYDHCQFSLKTVKALQEIQIKLSSDGL